MKKAILTFGLFSLVVLTSFTTTETQTQNTVAETGDDAAKSGGQGTSSAGSSSNNKKLDFVSNEVSVIKVKSEYNGYNSNLETYKKKSDI
ncbi:hypothetical protein D3C87_231440 [compost metagenome]